QAEDGIRDYKVTGVQTCALPISRVSRSCLWLSGSRTDRHRKPLWSGPTSSPGPALRNETDHRRGAASGIRSTEVGTQIRPTHFEIGRASCRERVENSVGAGGVYK